MKQTFGPALEAIKEAKRIIIHRHERPDGDAYGSQLGLYHLIKDNFPDKEVYMVGDSNERLSFMLHGLSMDDIPTSFYPDALAVILDTSAPTLISDERWTLARKTLRIDHHIFIDRIANVEIIDPSFESCCGIIALFAKRCKLKVSDCAATALFTGIATDSGRFRYDSTNSRTFMLASFLMERNIDTAAIYKALYTNELSFVKLKAKFALRIRTTEHNVAYTYTTKEELAQDGLDAPTAARAFVSVMGDIEGIGIWVAFTEGEDGVACELRSSGCSINPIAVKYGGGGHAKASGATVNSQSLAMEMLKELDALAAQSQATDHRDME